MKRLSIGTLALLVSATSSTAFARDTAQDADAIEHFERGKRLMTDKKYDAACDSFVKSLELKRGAGTMFNLADCWELAGRTASAHALFEEVALLTTQANQPERAALANTRAAELLDKLSKLEIKLAHDIQGLQVRRNGALVPEAELDVPVPLDPGTTTIEVTAPGKLPWTMSIVIPEQPGVTSLTVPELTDAPATVTPATVPVAPTPEDPAEQEPEEPAPAATAELSEQSLLNDQKTLTYGLVGLSALSFTAAIVMGTEFNANNSHAKRVCPSSRNCTDTEIRKHNDLVDSADRARTWGFVATGTGAALLGGAIYVWLSDDADSGVAAVPSWSADGVGASVSGTF